MDPEDLRSLARNAGVDLWTLIEAAISVAVKDCGDELKARRDGIVELLYARAAPPPRCLKCDPEEDRNRRRSNGREEEAKGSSSPVAKRGLSRSPPTPQSMNRLEVVEDDEEGDETQYRRGSNGGDATSKILAIKELLEDEDQSEDQVVSLLQDLADVDVTFEALEETDIGRHVNRFRKHPSADVQRLVKHIVRKWKAFVDNWVKSNSAGENAANNTDADVGYSPNPQNGSGEHVEHRVKEAVAVTRRDPAAVAVTRREPSQPPRRNESTTPSAPRAVQKDSLMDAERLASARKRLQDNYQEAQNARKQRTIQVMDIHEIPKPKVGRNKAGGSQQQSRHW